MTEAEFLERWTKERPMYEAWGHYVVQHVVERVRARIAPLGIDKDYSEALKWEKRSASHGYAKAQAELGYIYFSGRGVEKNRAAAIAWFRAAAEQNDASAEYNLGTLYETSGEAGALTHAVSWYRKAADQGLAPAQYRLGRLLVEGTGAPQDYNEGVSLLRKAAQSGDSNIRKAATEALAIIDQRVNSAVTQWLSTLSRNEIGYLVKIMSMMNCGQPIGTRYNIIDFANDERFNNNSWYDRLKLAWVISVAQCGAANTPPEGSVLNVTGDNVTAPRNRIFMTAPGTLLPAPGSPIDPDPKLVLDLGGGVYQELPQ